ncbi:unnamed protein product [Rangifer tarandus platyrhynchus]|uniref:Uncharacterized protein n=1 Tax=Rangifer tarandus platyrhynchus TaxID=3082113 RepID=A0ABN8YEX7_RANTA|nr:unnamed protein product [Rangifer tarandus platyrhynchus]
MRGKRARRVSPVRPTQARWSGRQREQCRGAGRRFRDRPLRASLARELRPGQVRVPEPAPPKGEHHPEKVLRRKFHRIKARAARSGEGSLVKGPLREAVQGEPWARTHGSDCCGRSPGRDGGCGVTRVRQGRTPAPAALWALGTDGLTCFRDHFILSPSMPGRSGFLRAVPRPTFLHFRLGHFTLFSESGPGARVPWG